MRNIRDVLIDRQKGHEEAQKIISNTEHWKEVLKQERLEQEEHEKLDQRETQEQWNELLARKEVGEKVCTFTHPFYPVF